MAIMNKKVAKFTYDFSVDGGAVSVITPAISESLPAGAIVTNLWTNERTAFTSGGSATIELKCGSVALSDAVAFDSAFAAEKTLALDNSLTAIEVTVNGTLTLTVAGAALTAGICDFFVEYVY
jgi:hypothetical protein